MQKIVLFISLIVIASCSNQKALEAKHQAETGNRLNQSQKNTDKLFEEMDK